MLWRLVGKGKIALCLCLGDRLFSANSVGCVAVNTRACANVHARTSELGIWRRFPVAIRHADSARLCYCYR